MKMNRKSVFPALTLAFAFAFGPACFAAEEIHKASQVQSAFIRIAEKSFPAVVVIVTKRKLELSDDPRMEDFFNSPSGRKYRRFHRRPPRQEIAGMGSGFFIDDKGHIVTNSHVVNRQAELLVKLHDGRELPAEVVGIDKKTDIAVLKVEVEAPAKYLEFEDSSKVKVGQWAIAVGAPFNFDYSMTVGIVSQKGRSVGLHAYEDFIQTDASINPGNSGGPLLNIDGKVIGVNNFIITGSQFSQSNAGLGFAIPSSMAGNVVNQLIKKGKVVRAWVGISMQELNPELKEQLSVENGVLVREVHTGNPADKAGILPGDVIVSVDSGEVNTPAEIQRTVLKHMPGDNIKFKILREGKEIEIEVTAGQQDEELLAMASPESGKAVEDAEQFGLKFSVRDDKVIISELKEGSAAELAGLSPGMEVESIEREQALRGNL